MEDTYPGGLSSITVQFRYMNFVWKIDEGEAESITLLIFVLQGWFNCPWMTGGGVTQKVFYKPSWNRIFLFLFFSQIGGVESWSPREVSRYSVCTDTFLIFSHTH